ncbi:uncharacterized protein LOC130771841 [Actinidia eriantha]|uniref:uncharacterized protein LOC130771841 n=1 Tax=Actinidia eriantha TaxID=165200 RepID=UPI00259097E7|nr:uncharacterized protein LOC130771841 [Actinidia eriantha]XP_057485522.1 uncharacterized protein LOC130771841 [Actinidia eriantha]
MSASGSRKGKWKNATGQRLDPGWEHGLSRDFEGDVGNQFDETMGDDVDDYNDDDDDDDGGRGNSVENDDLDNNEDFDNDDFGNDDDLA